MIRKLTFCFFLMCYASSVIAQKPVGLLWKHQNAHRDTNRTNIGFRTVNHHPNNPCAYQKKVGNVSFIASAKEAPGKIIHTNDQTILELNSLSAIQNSLKEISLQRNITLIGFLINFILAGLLCLACR